MLLKLFVTSTLGGSGYQIPTRVDSAMLNVIILATLNRVKMEVFKRGSSRGATHAIMVGVKRMFSSRTCQVVFQRWPSQVYNPVAIINFYFLLFVVSVSRGGGPTYFVVELKLHYHRHTIETCSSFAVVHHHFVVIIALCFYQNNLIVYTVHFFLCASVLNGSHGEYTETDDYARPDRTTPPGDDSTDPYRNYTVPEQMELVHGRVVVATVRYQLENRGLRVIHTSYTIRLYLPDALPANESRQEIGGIFVGVYYAWQGGTPDPDSPNDLSLFQWIVPELPPIGSYLSHDDLNGNNGEWTNGDDLDNALQQMANVHQDPSNQPPLRAPGPKFIQPRAQHPNKPMSIPRASDKHLSKSLLNQNNARWRAAVDAKMKKGQQPKAPPPKIDSCGLLPVMNSALMRDFFNIEHKEDDTETSTVDNHLCARPPYRNLAALPPGHPVQPPNPSKLPQPPHVNVPPLVAQPASKPAVPLPVNLPVIKQQQSKPIVVGKKNKKSCKKSPNPSVSSDSSGNSSIPPIPPPVPANIVPAPKKPLPRGMGRVYIKYVTPLSLLIDRIILFHKGTALMLLIMLVYLMQLIPSTHTHLAKLPVGVGMLIALVITFMYGENCASTHIANSTKTDWFYRPVVGITVFFSHSGQSWSQAPIVDLSMMAPDDAFYAVLQYLYNTFFSHSSPLEYEAEFDIVSKLGYNAYYNKAYYPLLYAALINRYQSHALQASSMKSMKQWILTEYPPTDWEAIDPSYLSCTVAMVFVQLSIIDYLESKSSAGAEIMVPLKGSYSRILGVRG